MKKFDAQAANNPDLYSNPAYRFMDTNETPQSEAQPKIEKAPSVKATPKAETMESFTSWNTKVDNIKNERKIMLYTTPAIANALKNAKTRTGKRVNQLINEILEIALRKAGYLGEEK